MVRGKNIVLCLDGTGNQFRENNSNVVKLFRVLDRSSAEQLAYYDPGVGTLADAGLRTKLAKRINVARGLAFGAGLIKNLEQAYSYLMDTYESGDRVLIFGFSRGAYTARALAAYIHAIGVMDRGCQNLIPYASQLFTASNPDWNVLNKFKDTYGRKCDIHFLGLWDSVSTFGWIYDPVFLPFTTNNPSVRNVRHALAIDERRAFFQPMPWGDKHRDKQNVKEVWFAGVHSDVGGGYPESESAVAKVALAWMVREATSTGNLKIDDKRYARFVLGQDTTPGGNGFVSPGFDGMLHNSLKGPWRLVQKLPQKVWSVKHNAKRLQMPPTMRSIHSGAVLHHSVINRFAAQQLAYRPKNLPLDEKTLISNYLIED
jgi:uncharacterized protein (DUF2235 family)